MEHHLDIFNSVLIPYFNFALFVGAFIFFFRKPLAAMATGRRAKFLDASKEAAAALTSAQTKFDEMKKKFDSIESELNAFKQESEALAKSEADRLVCEGERLAAQILAETKKLATEEINRARLELREEIVSAAKKTAKEQIESGLSDADKSRILNGRTNDLRSYHV